MFNLYSTEDTLDKRLLYSVLLSHVYIVLYFLAQKFICWPKIQASMQRCIWRLLKSPPVSGFRHQIIVIDCLTEINIIES